MGMHTWCYSNRELYKKLHTIEQELEEQCDTTSPDEIKIETLYQQSYELEIQLKTEFHDIFRTNKREPSGEYCNDLLYSESDTHQWLEQNKEYVSFININQLTAFWRKYPKGVIAFG